MIETFTIITLSLLALYYFRSGKVEALQSPLVINRVGQFQATLSPMLNLALPLLENISQSFSMENREGSNAQPHYFMVRDKEVKAHGADFYLLAVTLDDGVLYFQAIAPKADEDHLDTIRTFSEANLMHHADKKPHIAVTDTALMAAVQAAANQRNATLTSLT